MRAPQAEKYGYLKYFEVESARRRRKKLILEYSGIGFFGYLQNLVFTKGSEKLDELGEM